MDHTPVPIDVHVPSKSNGTSTTNVHDEDACVVVDEVVVVSVVVDVTVVVVADVGLTCPWLLLLSELRFFRRLLCLPFRSPLRRDDALFSTLFTCKEIEEKSI